MTTLPPTWPPPPEGTPPPRVERVRYCCELMRLGLWVRGESGLVLAELWGLSKAIVRNDSADASHIVRARLDETDVTTLRAEVVNNLRWASKQARKAAQMDPARGGKLAVDAAKAFAEVTGAGAPRKAQVQVTAVDEVPFGFEEVPDGE